MNWNLENMVLKVTAISQGKVNRGTAICKNREYVNVLISVPDAAKYAGRDILIKIDKKGERPAGGLDENMAVDKLKVYVGNFLTSYIPPGFETKRIEEVIFYAPWTKELNGTDMPEDINEINKTYDPGGLEYAYLVIHRENRSYPESKLTFRRIAEEEQAYLGNFTLGQFIFRFRKYEGLGAISSTKSKLLLLGKFVDEELIRKAIVENKYYPLKLEPNPK
jgi:hypothetical protein